ncbi:MAG: hypothetical protein O7B35_11905 [Deltaproteobacteria bacterium]|nr:hypothetical protein [Deltaproteobacteria bacterium]
MSFVHGDVWTAVAGEPEKVFFEETKWGGVYKAIRAGRKVGEYNYREHPIIMPGIASGGDSAVSFGEDVQASPLPTVTARWSVPIDDTHTMNVRLFYRPPKAGPKQKRRASAKQLRIEPYKEYKEIDNPTLGYDIPSAIPGEDATILESLGPIVDRENENLSVIDGGISIMRDFYLKQIEAIRAGKDPKGVIRDKEKNQLIVIGGNYEWASADERRELLRATA